MLTLKRILQVILVPILALNSLQGCSTAEVAPDSSVMPEVPDYVKVPHPVGYEIAEIRALFENPLAPKDGLGSFTENCDQEFRLLAQATSIKEERRQGAGELVTLNAEKMHWCFYGKVERMQYNLKNEQSWSARQKIVLGTYEFLTPIANAFLAIYHDSRYMRWATQYYSQISEWIFFRKVVPGPENTLALTTSATTDLESWTTENAKNKQKLSVFTRYGIELKQGMDASPVEPSARRQPAQTSAEVETVSVAPAPAAAAPISLPEAEPAMPASAIAPSPERAVLNDSANVPVPSAIPDVSEEIGAVVTEPGAAPIIDTTATKPGRARQPADLPLAPIPANAQVRDPASVKKAAPAKRVAPKKTYVEPETPVGL